MDPKPSSQNICIVIGAGHAGVSVAFALRREGWQGRILLYDADAELPYQRPPLSKKYISQQVDLDQFRLAPPDSYEQHAIELRLGIRVQQIDPTCRTIILADGTVQPYTKLVLATGARPYMPPIPGIAEATQLFPLRSARDATQIMLAWKSQPHRQVVVIGGGYIGLEIAASLRKLGAEITVLEREVRVLARVTSPAVSECIEALHRKNGVSILNGKAVSAIKTRQDKQQVHCSDGSQFEAGLIILGTGIIVNRELAAEAGLVVDEGICVQADCQTSDPDIYAIGDCTLHFSPLYDRHVRLESVQNAVDQAKVAAAAICGGKPQYRSLPWFWSDQYDLKIQIAGLFEGYQEAIVRKEADGSRMSVWYFRGETLLAVDALNDARAYVTGTKILKEGGRIDKARLSDLSVECKPAQILIGGIAS